MARAVESRLAGVELDRSKPRVGTEGGGRRLIHRNRVVKARASSAVGIGAGEPKRAAAVRIVGKPVGPALDDREVGLMAGQRGEPLRKCVARSDIVLVGKPGLLGHAVAYAETDHPLGRRDRCGRPGKPSEAERLERGQGQQRGCRPQEPAA